ncbi:transferase 1, rSAM/selenodomain-associated [Pedobacter glucosidilyticus]|nr:DUF2064 domain-containing protein [Pedobacter glucosidilyticus]KHJ39451.1 transferase 1, rSAM/selenodomain-associated [Pedobacter glucosidilyticus]
MSKTAIIIFSHVPEIEARIKDFAGFKNTRRVSALFTKHFIELAKNTHTDTFWHNSLVQEGKNFGERLANAFESMYAKGYDAVVCIGNDCPELQKHTLQKALKAIENGKTVLGPTTDAGAYLIAIPKKAFHKKHFLQVKWQSSCTYKDLKALFQNEELLELKELQDLDYLADFYPLKDNKLVAIALEFIHPFTKSILNHTFYSQKSIRNYDFKAPPVII